MLLSVDVQGSDGVSVKKTADDSSSPRQGCTFMSVSAWMLVIGTGIITAIRILGTFISRLSAAAED